jgi:DNA-binding transcriptional LysR family regulator
MDLDLLQVFVAVGETGSFSAAAKALGLPKSSISRGISKLEAQVGAQLLHRTTRQVALSTAGAALFEKAALHIAGMREALGTLPERGDEPAGDLRITAPPDIGAVLLSEMLPRFVARYPRVHVDAHFTGRKVDLVGEAFDVALRATGRLADSTLVQRKLVTLELQLYAAPSYLGRRGTPRSIEEVCGHDIVWFRPLRAAKRMGVDQKRARLQADDFWFIREALCAGAGIGPLPTFVAHSLVQDGQLVRVLPRHVEPGGTLVLLHPRAQNVPRKVTAFRDFLLETLARKPLA